MLTLKTKGGQTMEFNLFLQLYMNASDDVRHHFEELLTELEEQPVSLEEEIETA